MREISEGKDTVTGHWEIAGLDLRPGFALFPPGPPSFAPELMAAFEQETGRPALGNKAASGTAVIDELGPASMAGRGAWIVYTSADSVFQIAANIDVIPLADLYAACAIARRLCDPLRVGRVIARPFRGTPGNFHRTEDRRDYAFQPAEPTLLERLHDAGVPVCAVGKIEDIFAHRGITHSNHTGNNRDSQQAVEAFHAQIDRGFIFANFIDFDMHFGHRRDPAGYADCLRQTDAWLASFLPRLASDDLLLLTADHGNDPTYRGSDHTREIVPLLVYGPGRPARPLGVRQGFFDLAQSVAARHGLPPLPRGVSFL
jgi:phosphopentomutase